MNMTRTMLVVATAAVVSLAAIAQTPAPGSPQVPLRTGLTIVTALNGTLGDYESIKRVTDADAKTVTISYSVDLPPPADRGNDPVAALLGAGSGGCDPNADPKKRVKGSVTRTVLREDLASAHSYRQRFNICADGGETFPGTTALGVSSAVLKDLNGSGQSKLSMAAGGPAGALAGLIGSMLGGASSDIGDLGTMSGTIARVERGTLPFKVIVNDVPTELRAVHAKGNLNDDPAEFWFLDDAANPLSLKWTLSNGDKLHVIKISYPPEEDAKSAAASSRSGGSGAPAAAENAGATRIEHELAETGTSVVYGIYFDFASDRIKPESDEVLDEIATVMRKNPTWKLSVDGHTDSIGGAAANLDLSKRRSAAVKQALVTRYKIDPARLVTDGFGASRPKDTNETIEGRARNRRVELRKQ